MPEFQQESSELPYVTSLSNLLVTWKGRVFFAFILFCFVFLSTYPKYLDILLDPTPIHTYPYFFQKIKAPFQQIQMSEETHASKASFRLTMALFGKLLNIGKEGAGQDIVLLYLFQSLLLAPFFLILVKLFQRFTDNISTVLFAIAFSSIYVTTAFYWDYDFWFDGVAFFFLLLGMYLQNKVGIFFALQLACWTDERAVIALSSVYLFHILQENNFDFNHLRQIFNKSFFQQKATIVVLTGVFYLALRFFLSYTFNLYTPQGEGTGVGLFLLPYQLTHRLSGVFFTFEALWLIFIIVMVSLAKKKKLLLIFAICSIMVIHIIVAYSVFDITRSLSYAFPLLIICGVLMSKNDFKWGHYILFGTALLCIFIKTQYLIFYPHQIPWSLLSYDEFKLVIKHYFSIY